MPVHRRSLAALIAIVCLLAALSSCSSGNVAPTSAPIDPSQLADARIAGRASAAFALDLLRKLDDDGNVVLSPWSITQALTMTAAGARGETQREMLAALGVGDSLPVDRLQTAVAAVSDHSAPLTAANALFPDARATIVPAFASEMQRTHHATITPLDFSPANAAAAAAQINNWASQHTHGMVRDIVSAGDVTNNRLVIGNAVSFHGEWKTVFDHTAPGAFHLADGSSVPVTMMSHTHVDTTFSRARGRDLIAVSLPYQNSGCEMCLIVPTTGSLADLEAGLTGGQLDNLFDALDVGHDDKCQVVMPRFKFEWRDDLNDALKALGMRRAFVPGEADLTGIIADGSLFISLVRHGACIEVDEKGTRAAAVTTVHMNKSMPPPPLMFDRPFLFLIRHVESGAILFIGRFVKP
ncbi:MAG: serpin family protein [Planctomycetota bacterium]